MDVGGDDRHYGHNRDNGNGNVSGDGNGSGPPDDGAQLPPNRKRAQRHLLACVISDARLTAGVWDVGRSRCASRRQGTNAIQTRCLGNEDQVSPCQRCRELHKRTLADGRTSQSRVRVRTEAAAAHRCLIWRALAVPTALPLSRSVAGSFGAATAPAYNRTSA